MYTLFKSMGPAPKWCSFLDNLTEELEANPTSTGKAVTYFNFILLRFSHLKSFMIEYVKLFLYQVYDDYKFVTKPELDSLGLSNLIGTNVLRAYMHGYFMDIRLYKKAKLITEPFNFEEFKQRKIKEKIENERENRVKITRKLPTVNTELAKRLIEEKEEIASKLKKNKVMLYYASIRMYEYVLIKPQKLLLQCSLETLSKFKLF